MHRPCVHVMQEPSHYPPLKKSWPLVSIFPLSEVFLICCQNRQNQDSSSVVLNLPPSSASLVLSLVLYVSSQDFLPIWQRHSSPFGSPVLGGNSQPSGYPHHIVHSNLPFDIVVSFLRNRLCTVCHKSTVSMSQKSHRHLLGSTGWIQWC